MKDDQGHLEELLQSKFKDDVIKPSTDMFDSIYEAVQDQKTKRNYLPWYQAGIILTMVCAILILYVVMNTKNSDTNNPQNTEENTPFTTQENNNPIIQKEEKEEEIHIDTIETKEAGKPETRKNPVLKNPVIENTTSRANNKTGENTDENFDEKGLIGVSYIASEKYASTQRTKYIRLPDSSIVVMRKNSRVNFNASAQGYRRVDLTGTVFFTVKENDTVPFIIHGKYCTIKISGPSFAMSSEKGVDRMTLIKGTAEITLANNGQIQNVTVGESYGITPEGITRLKNAPNQFAWKTHSLYYNNATVNRIIQDLGENYNAKILLKDREIVNCTYTGSFDTADIKQILQVLTTALGVQLTKEDDIFVVRGKGNCNK